jgi:hypothetical protein
MASKVFFSAVGAQIHSIRRRLGLVDRQAAIRRCYRFPRFRRRF